MRCPSALKCMAELKVVAHLCDFLDLHLVGGRCPTKVCQVAAACIMQGIACCGSRLAGAAAGWQGGSRLEGRRQAGRDGSKRKRFANVTHAPDDANPANLLKYWA